ncbi:Stage V sporulation protein D [bacterium HR17]|uniref:Stage V sporulation protein D n=1 Tax=Candidatus Fervidibacter japonicus TaxID=2035412 RepID=A0A2H5XDC5_9BACT|nr:Stage V sporulation protein D [bacterium HR17]
MAFVGMLLVGGTLAAWLFRLQVLSHSAAQRTAMRTWLRRVEVAPARGNIYSRNFRLLATCEPTYSVWADPQTLREAARREKTLRGLSPNALAHRLTTTLLTALDAPGVTASRVQRLLTCTTRNRGGAPVLVRFVWIARQLDGSAVRRLQATLRRPSRQLSPEWRVLKTGIGVCTELRRVYPYGRLAAAALGFVDWDNRGRYGVERSWDTTLRGRAGTVEQEVDASGQPIPQGYAAVVPSVPGDSLVLTLDEQIQQAADAVLDAAMAQYRPRAATAVVLEPHSGDILAIASKPDFDPNAYWRFPVQRFNNLALSFVYEPGSTLKPLIAAALLESGTVSDQTTTRCDGIWKTDGFVVRCWVVQRGIAAHGIETLADALCNSCNIAMARFALRLPYAQLYKTLTAFGLGRKMDAGMGYEERGWLDPPPVEAITTPAWQHRQACIAFGQGLMVTPLQLAVAYAALANNGLVVRPRIVRGIRDAQTGRVRWLKPQVIGAAVSPLTARKVREMLVNVVERGTGKRAHLSGVTVAGKTGTATKVVNGRYDPTKVVVSFFGFLPADRPRWVIGIVLDEPAYGKWGGEVAAPLFAALGRRILWRVQPPRPLSLSQHLTAPLFSSTATVE